MRTTQEDDAGYFRSFSTGFMLQRRFSLEKEPRRTRSATTAMDNTIVLAALAGLCNMQKMTCKLATEFCAVDAHHWRLATESSTPGKKDKNETYSFSEVP